MIAGCATYTTREAVDSLEKTLRSYEMAIRWGHYEVVMDAIQDFDNQAQNFNKFRNIKITSYEVLGLKISASDLMAEQKVEIRYYNPDFMLEKMLIDIQSWEYNKDVKKWYLHSNFPDFR